jgi:hypothetical protein
LIFPIQLSLHVKKFHFLKLKYKKLLCLSIFWIYCIHFLLIWLNKEKFKLNPICILSQIFCFIIAFL